MPIKISILLMFMIMIVAQPVWADDQRPSSEPSPGFQAWELFDLANAKRFIEEVYKRGMDALEDRVEFEGSFRPDQQAERQGHLSLRLYPKGKAHSEDNMTAETWFGFSNKPEEDRLHFDFKFHRDQKPAGAPQDYI